MDAGNLQEGVTQERVEILSLSFVAVDERKNPNFSTLKRYSKKTLENSKKTIDNNLPKCYTNSRKRGNHHEDYC